ncbi:hypothetical protein [Mycobacteroides abscessus]|uniref:hypothetical protein n=1 Tax=Mycobacteroides abscessus TaxID=36809 RepID=UPI0009CA43E0|nr:hypothetical protein [Mycobacteroides abscessus]SKD26457.1 Uncharacterised protein [Mycobacteroides abscessus subsp. massiliense]SKI14407.1 Uncharacterised protein [Mycobacteroides abscessus subsp. massiliense]SKL96808.1 Uncharacterised protein [Mycobacteroides abscessus subsp. massiliense]SKM69364.1 Uncharacterised protein [Mycobacteroides abscessus subsp. massiliense]SKN53546.1 Uncharacterised protein [Mycobacteroides abscessus subsp. massiliense]
MSKTNRPNYRRADREDRSRRHHRQDRRIVVRGVRRDPPDLRKLSRAVIALALAEMEDENSHSTDPEINEPNTTQQDIAQSNDACELVSDASEDGEVRS